MKSNSLPVVVIGAGPVGLAAAAHLAIRNLPYLVLERGLKPATAIRNWAHVTIFSPWRFNVDSAARGLLELTGWSLPAEDLDRDPTGEELIERYIEPLAKHPRIAPYIRYGAEVVAVTRHDMDLLRNEDRAGQPFELVVKSAGGGETRLRARAVIDATGTWSTPNPAGANGLPAQGERQCGSRIRYGIPDVRQADRERYAGKRVLVIGSGHSAMDVVLDLARLKTVVPSTEIVWAMRSTPTAKTFGGADADQLASRGALGSRTKALTDQGLVTLVAPFRTNRFAMSGDQVIVTGNSGNDERSERVDKVVVATGFRPDFTMYLELRLDLDPAVQAPRALAPLIDPNLHSCGSVPPHGHRELAQPEPNFFMVGMKSYGRAPTFLMATGYEQVRSVVAALAGDLAAADDVRLVVPETGVCEGVGHTASACCAKPNSADIVSPGSIVVADGCCGGPAADDASSCCVAGSKAKQAGNAGCGCGDIRAQVAG